jgi:hypothetical protein
MDVASFSTGNVTQLLYGTKPLITFANTPGDAERLIGMIEFIKKEWKGDRPPRVATLAYEASTSRQGEDPRLFKMAKEKGVEFLPFDYFPFTATDFTTELKRIHEERKADYVWLRGQPAQVGVIMKNVARLGLKDKMKWIACYFGYADVVRDIAGVDTVAGMYAEGNFAVDTEVNNPGVKFVRQLHSKYRTPKTDFNFYLSGIHLSMVAHEATKRALEKVGLKKLGGRAIADGVWSMKNFDVMGLTPPITMEQGNISLVRSCRMSQVNKEGRLVPISGWMPVPWILGR